jgi:hypothetical protein
MRRREEIGLTVGLDGVGFAGPYAPRLSISSQAAARRPSSQARAQLLPGAPLSTVTARRFCDQQEMSSQVATGRSLP